MISKKPIGRTYKGYYIDFYLDESNEFWFPMDQIMEMLNIKDIDLDEVVDVTDENQYRIEKIDEERIILLSIHGLDYFEKLEHQQFLFFEWIRTERCNMFNLFQWLKESTDITTPNMLIPAKCKQLLADLIGMSVNDIWN